jgi:hypothetical protein
MTGRLDRFGEPLEDDNEPLRAPGPIAGPTRRTRDELRAILRAARERREAQR